MRNAIYTYEDFLLAVAKFPSFCGEGELESAGYDKDQTCGRELATLFAHFTQETGYNDPGKGETWKQALYHIEEMNCVEGAWGRG